MDISKRFLVFVLVFSSPCCDKASDQEKDGGAGADSSDLGRDGGNDTGATDGDVDGDADAGKSRLLWAKSAGGDFPTKADVSTRLVVHSDGSVFVTGYFFGKAVFGKDEPNETSYTSTGYADPSDAFIARYHPDGTLAWAKRAYGTDFDFGQGITVLSDGSSIVTGGFEGSAKFGDGEENSRELASLGTSDAFIAKYNPDGTFLWVKSVVGEGYEMGYAVATLSDESFLVCGIFGMYAQGATFGPGEPNEIDMPGEGGDDVFVAKYKQNGDLEWVRSAAGEGHDDCYAIDVFADGSFAIGGTFSETATFGKGEMHQTILTAESTYYPDLFIAKYHADGTLNWAKSAGGLDIETIEDIEALPDGSVLATGDYMNIAVFGKGEANETELSYGGMYLAKYKADGALAWVKRAGQKAKGYGVSEWSDGAILLVGTIGKDTVFDEGGTNEVTLSSLGNSDIFVAQYNSEGMLDWIFQEGGENTQFMPTLSVGKNGLVGIAGSFSAESTWGIGEKNETHLTAIGGPEDEDIFIALLSLD